MKTSTTLLFKSGSPPPDLHCPNSRGSSECDFTQADLRRCTLFRQTLSAYGILIGTSDWDKILYDFIDAYRDSPG